MSPHDTLHDRLADAAGAVRPSVPDGSAVRRSAVRHRVQRRVLGGSAVLVAVAAAVLTGSTLLAPRTTSLGPATPNPTVTSAPAPTSSDPAPTSTAPPSSTTSTSVTTTPVGPPPLTGEEARAFVEELRFEREPATSEPDEWSRTSTTHLTMSAHECDPVPDQRVLAARSYEDWGPDTGSLRQLTLFATADDARAAFADLRAAMRLCHAPFTYQDGPYLIDQTVVGGQLELGDESFWVATKGVIREAEGLPERVGTEQPYKTASLLVLDDNVVVHIEDPAAGDDARRADFVATAGAEWERLQGRYEPVTR